MFTALRQWLAAGVLTAGSLVSAAAAAADITVDARIDRVTVYRHGALVTRSAAVTLPAGSQRILFRNLPADIDEKTLQVTASGEQIQLGDIEVIRITDANFVSDAERDLRARIEALTDQQTVLKDEVATAQSQLKLLDSLAANPAGSPNKAVVDAANLAAVLNTMNTSEGAARKRVRDVNVQLRGLTRQLDQLNGELKKVATGSKESTEVRAAALVAASVAADVSVTYQVPEAEWHWVYQARLDTMKKHLTLERQGQVTQGTGEDWKNVSLTLTTAAPSGHLDTPTLGSLFVDLRPILPPAAKFQESRAMAFASRAAAPSAENLSEVVVTGARRLNADAESTEYMADYHVPNRLSVLGDRQGRLFPIGQNGFDVDLVARVVPSGGSAAHLEAVFKYTEELPFEAGQLELYRDGAFVGEAETQAYLPGADVRMPFGTDERLRVAIRSEATQSGQSGIISKQTVQETRRRIEVTNYHPSPIAVEILDRIPVSRAEDVRVQVLKGATDPTVKDLDGKAGVWLWKLRPDPQQTVSIHQAYSVEYPSGREIREATEE